MAFCSLFITFVRRWGGCSDSSEFAESLARTFLDEREVGHDPRAIINLHNNQVGRMVS